MTYDPIDTNDDGVVDADVDNQSVSTEKASFGGNWESVKPGSTETEIQAAIDNVNSAGGGLVYLPGDNYSVGSTITIRDNVALVGAGKWQTTLDVPSSLTNNVIDSVSAIENALVASLQIESDGGGGQGIQYRQPDNCDVWGVHILGHEKGIRYFEDGIQTNNGGTISNVEIEKTTGTPVEIKRQYVNFVNNKLYDCSDNGLVVTQKNQLIAANTITNCGRGIQTLDARAHIIGNVINHNGGSVPEPAIEISSGSAAVLHNRVIANNGTGILVGSSESTVNGNVMAGNGTSGGTNSYNHIDIDGVSGCMVHGNYAGRFGSDQIQYGISEINSASGNSIRSNVTKASGGFNLASTAIGQNDTL